MNRLLITPKNAGKDTPIATAAATASLEQDTVPAAAPPPATERATPAQPPVLLEIETDVSLDGTPAREWLVVTPDSLTVCGAGFQRGAGFQPAKSGVGFQRGAGFQPANVPSTSLRTIPWPDVEQVRTTAGVGGGTLQVKTDGDWVDLVRYSNAFATRFHKVSRALEGVVGQYGRQDVGSTASRQDACSTGGAGILPAKNSTGGAGILPAKNSTGGAGILPAKNSTGGAGILPAKNSTGGAGFQPAKNSTGGAGFQPAKALLLFDDALDPPRCPSCSLRLQTREQSCPRCMQKGRILARVGELLAPYTRGAILLCLLTLLGVVAELVPPKLQQYMVDNILSQGAAEGAAGQTLPDFKTALLVVVLALAFSRVVLSVVGVLKGQLATAIGTGLTGTLRAEMVTKLQDLSIAYYDRHQVGSMISRVAHDSEVLHGLMHQLTGGFLLQIVQLVGVGAMLVWINPKLALFTLIPVPLVLLGSWVFWRHVYPRHYRLWDASSKQMAALSGMLSGIRVVKAFAQESRESDRFKKASDHLSNWRLWVEQTNSTYAATMQLVFGLGGLIVWYVGGRDVIGGQMTLGQLIAFLAYLAMFYAPLGALSNFTTWLTSFLSGSQRVLELLDTPVTIAEAERPVPWNDVQGAIRFDNVTFGYDRNQPVLRDVSFDVKPGEMIGIVGRSGSGKTTLVNLLGRFYDVQEGRIEIDGIDLRDLSTKELRERLGIVFQDSFLFRGTIWKNLSYGKPNATIEQGLVAAKAAGAHDFLCRQPLAYETLLGEHGAGLSGGEKQRLSIARTLLYDPRILVLDEATSNIDAEAEKSIQDALAVLIKGRTTIAIAHRLSTLRNADRILAFDRGKLVEQGTHAELLAADGIYARLVKIQTQVSKQPTVDTLLSEDEEKKPAADAADEQATSKNTLRWLDPAEHAFRLGNHGRIEMISRPLAPQADPQKSACGASGLPLSGLLSVFVVRTFPATHPEEYLSVRGWNDSGEEIELGMMRSLADWPAESQEVVRTALKRRSLVRTIERVHDVKLGHGYLDFDVETDVGRQKFTTRWTGSQAIDFGPDGKMLIDTEENRFVVPQVSALPAPDREKFLHYVYW